MLDALRQCESFTLSALGHADDDMVFDWNSDMACSTPTAAGTALQKHINISRKSQRDTGWTPTVSPVANLVQKAPVPMEIPRKGAQANTWISRLEEFNKLLWRWTCALWKTTWITVAILSSLTILLYLLQHCAIPAAKTGKEIWDQMHARKAKEISAEQQTQDTPPPKPEA